MTKKRSLLVVLLGLCMALCLSFGVACRNKEEKKEYTIGWDYDKTLATVTAEGYNTLPETLEQDTEITFTVTVKDGYQVTSVLASRVALRANGGKYSHKVIADTTFHINVDRTVEKVEVTSTPEKPTYYAGESVDRSALVVKATYGTGDVEEITNYTVSPAVFSLGDTSFTVSYGGKSATVELNETVVGKVELDLQGGTVSEAYLQTLENNEELANVKQENGKVTFTFAKKLLNEIKLPVNTEGETQITRVDDENYPDDFSFSNWEGNAKIVPADTEVSVTYKAIWNAKLLDLESVSFETRKNEENADVAYLVIKGTYRAAKTAFLYLYEGNSNVELIGPTIGDETKERGDSFELLFSMRELALAESGAFLTMWMDIKFVAENDGVRDVQDININDYASDFVDLDAQLIDPNMDYIYTFATHSPTEGVKNLKAVAQLYFPADYTIAAANGEKGEPLLVISGTMKSDAYNGNAVMIDWWIDRTIAAMGTIGEDRKWSITFDLSDWPLETMGYAHVKIVKSENDGTVVWGSSSEFNLPTTNCKDAAWTNNGSHSDVTGRTIIVRTDDYRIVFYVGEPSWNGLVAYGQNEAMSVESFRLHTEMVGEGEEAATEKAYFDIYGTYRNDLLTKERVEEELAKMYANVDISSLGVVSSNNDYVAFARSLADGTMRFHVDDEEEGNFWRVYIEIPAEAQNGWVLFIHTGSNANLYTGGHAVYTEPVTVGNMKYSLETLGGFSGDDKAWINGIIAINVIDETAKEIKLAEEGAVLKVDNFENPTKVYYVVKLAVRNYTAEELQNAFVFGNDDGSGYFNTAKVVKIGDNIYEFWFDVTEFRSSGAHPFLWSNIYTSETHEKLFEVKDAAASTDGMYAIVNGVKYVLHSTWDTYYNSVCLATEEPGENDTNSPELDPDYVTPELKILLASLQQEDNAVYYVLAIRVKGYADATLASAVLYDGDTQFTLHHKEKENLGDDNVWLFYFDVTAYRGGQFYPHLKFGDVPHNGEGGNGDVTAPYVNKSVKIGEVTYSIVNGWGMPTLVVDDETMIWELTGADLTSDDDGVYFVVSGTYLGYSEEDLRSVLGSIDFALQENSAVVNNNGGDYSRSEWIRGFDYKIEIEGNTWKILYNVSTLEPYAYFGHFNNEDLKLDLDSAPAEKVITWDGRIYTMINAYGGTDVLHYWGCVALRIEDADAPYYAKLNPTNAHVEKNDEGDKAYFVLSGTYTDIDEDSIERVLGKVYFDFQQRGGAWNRYTSFERIVNWNTASGLWTIKFDVTGLPADGNPYTSHFKTDSGDIKLDRDHAPHDENATLNNNASYTLVNFNGTDYPSNDQNNWGEEWNWGNVSLKVVNPNAPKLTFTKATLETDDAENPTKVWLVLEAEFENYTEAELKTITYFEQQMTLTVEKVEINDGTVKLYFNFTNVDPNGEWWWGHWTVNGNNMGDVKCTVVESEVVFGGIRYKLNTEWEMPIVVVTRV